MNAPKVQFASRHKLSGVLHEKAMRMRRNPTEAEAVVWNRLKGNRLGVRFRRQHVIDRFIVDLYCPRLALVIEIDGGIHDGQQQRDMEREAILKGLGCNVIRFRNEEVSGATNTVVRTIQKKIVELIDRSGKTPSPL